MSSKKYYIRYNESLHSNPDLNMRENHYDSKKILLGISIVEKFLKTNKYIILGGTAIDFALRLKGASIYDDDSIADYDFYSTNNYDTALNLYSLLLNAGLTDTLCIVRAIHVTTYRIMYRSYPLADITYCPHNIYDKLDRTALKYKGFTILNPLDQRIDLHRSFVLPLENTGREVLKSRWIKDTERLLMFDKYYPVVVKIVPKKYDGQEYPYQLFEDTCLIGDTAVSYYESDLSVSGFITGSYGELKSRFKDSLNMIKFTKQFNPMLEIAVASNDFTIVDIVHRFIKYFKNKTNTIKLQYVKPYLDKLPQSVIVFVNSIPRVKIYDFSNCQISIYSTVKLKGFKPIYIATADFTCMLSLIKTDPVMYNYCRKLYLESHRKNKLHVYGFTNISESTIVYEKQFIDSNNIKFPPNIYYPNKLDNNNFDKFSDFNEILKNNIYYDIDGTSTVKTYNELINLISSGESDIVKSRIQ
jgi:hypothetical protein